MRGDGAGLAFLLVGSICKGFGGVLGSTVGGLVRRAESTGSAGDG